METPDIIRLFTKLPYETLEKKAMEYGKNFLKTGNPSNQTMSELFHKAKMLKAYLETIKNSGGANTGLASNSLLGAAGGVAGAASAGWSLGQQLNKTPLLTDPNMTYGDFYTNLFRRGMMQNAK